MGIQYLLLLGVDILWFINFICMLVYLFSQFISYEWCNDNVWSKALVDCNYFDMYCLIEFLVKYSFIYCKQSRLSKVSVTNSS